MIASLPMYDRPDTRAANDRLWSLVRANLPEEPPLPDSLTRSADLWDDWLLPDLVFSQTCSLPYRAKLKGKVRIIGTPVLKIDCAAGLYFSQIVIRKSDSRRCLGEFNGARLAINDDLSQSGWGSIHGMALAQSVEFNEVIATGAHQNSVRAIAENRADIAAIDAVTWEMLLRSEPLLDELQIIARTPATPATPYITGPNHDPEVLYDALESAIASLSEQDRQALCLSGVTRLAESAYLDQPTPPRRP